MSKQQQSVVASRIALTTQGVCTAGLLLLALGSAGCGQKGPLYLPGAQKSAPPAAAASAAPAAKP